MPNITFMNTLSVLYWMPPQAYLWRGSKVQHWRSVLSGIVYVLSIYSHCIWRKKEKKKKERVNQYLVSNLALEIKCEHFSSFQSGLVLSWDLYSVSFILVISSPGGPEWMVWRRMQRRGWMVSLCLCRKAGESSSKQVNGSKFKKVITKVTLLH